MELAAIASFLAPGAQLIPVVYAVVGIIKRFIPDKTRTVANPIIAVVTGLLGAYMTGGQAEVVSLLANGALAAAGAIGAYSVPKEIGKKLGTQ